MTDYDAATYGDRMAQVYDEWFAVPSDTEDTVGFLSDLAGKGPVLELGVGTGRVAIPLAQRGHEVHGIDASEAMVEKLRAKTGDVAVTIGDFAELEVGGKFSLVYVVFNTLFALLTQELGPGPEGGGSSRGERLCHPRHVQARPSRAASRVEPPRRLRGGRKDVPGAAPLRLAF